MPAKSKEPAFVPHPGLDFNGGDPALVAAIEQGQELVVNVPFKRAGVEYQRGDKVRLGDLEVDGYYSKLNPVAGTPWVVLPAVWEFWEYDHRRKDYERDTLEPLRTRLQWAARELGHADAAVHSLEAQLKHAKSEQTQARSEKAAIQKQLDKALSGGPQPPV